MVYNIVKFHSIYWNGVLNGIFLIFHQKNLLTFKSHRIEKNSSTDLSSNKNNQELLFKDWQCYFSACYIEVLNKSLTFHIVSRNNNNGTNSQSEVKKKKDLLGILGPFVFPQ